MSKKLSNPWNGYIVFIVISLITIGLIYYLSPILMPFVLGALFAYVSNPLVINLMHFRLSRMVASIIVFFALFFCFIVFILLLIPVIQKQLFALSLQLPNIITWMEEKINSVLAYFDLKYINVINFKNILTEKVMISGSMASWVVSSGKALFESVLSLILIPIVTFYLLRDWDEIFKNIRDSLPNNIKPTIVRLSKECDAVLGAFFRGQLLVMLILGIFYSIALTIFGLQLGVVIGILVGLTNIVPYLGLIIGLTIATIAALVQFGTITSVLWIVLIFAVGHLLENFYLTPKLIGTRIGLHPIVVIFAILAGGTLFGFFGILLALPVAAMIMVLLRHIHHVYFHKHNLKNV